MRQSPGEPLARHIGLREAAIPTRSPQCAPGALREATRQSPGEPLRGTSGYEKPQFPSRSPQCAPGALREATRQSPGERLRGTSGYAEPEARSRYCRGVLPSQRRKVRLKFEVSA
jgi:hypothetical protein